MDEHEGQFTAKQQRSSQMPLLNKGSGRFRSHEQDKLEAES
jgi:hypothetical protein